MVSELIEKAMDCIEEYSEIQVIIYKGEEHIILNQNDKFIWNYKRTLL